MRILRHPTAVITLFALLLLLPAFLLGAGGIDLHSQSLWVRHFSAQLWHGEAYPRWLIALFAGNGSPVFFYYPPLTYFITALFAPLARLDVFGFHPIAASCLVAVIISGLTCYCWMREETDDAKAALMASLFYMAAPNHLAQNFYHMLTFSTVWAYAFAPLLMLFAGRIARDGAFGVAGYATCLGLMVMTNIPMTVLFGSLSFLYGLILLPQEHLLSVLGRLLLAALLGFALSAIFLLPSLSYMNYANVNYHWTNLSSRSTLLGKQFVLGSDRPLHRLNSAYLLASTLLAAACLHYARAGLERIFFTLAAAFSLFMMLPVSQPLWLHLPGALLLQFPIRFFAVTTLCAAALMARMPQAPRLLWATIALCLIVTYVTAALTRTTLEEWKKTHPIRAEHYLMNVDQYPYYLTSLDLVERYLLRAGNGSPQHEEALVIQGEGYAAATQWQPRAITLSYDAVTDCTVRVRQFYFPGFKAWRNGEPWAITREKDTGDMLLSLPKGKGEVQLRLTELWPERAGRIITLCAAFILLFLMSQGFKAATRPSAAPSLPPYPPSAR